VSNQGAGGGGGAGQKNIVLQTTGGQADVKTCIACVYGAKQTPLLLKVDTSLDGDQGLMSVSGTAQLID
jgi:hypothetical protein